MRQFWGQLTHRRLDGRARHHNVSRLIDAFAKVCKLACMFLSKAPNAGSNFGRRPDLTQLSRKYYMVLHPQDLLRRYASAIRLGLPNGVVCQVPGRDQEGSNWNYCL
jgi:hypothetical protein